MEIQQCEQLYTTQGDELVNYVLPKAHRVAGGVATSIKYMRKFVLSWPDYEIVQRAVAQILWQIGKIKWHVLCQKN